MSDSSDVSTLKWSDTLTLDGCSDEHLHHPWIQKQQEKLTKYKYKNGQNSGE